MPKSGFDPQRHQRKHRRHNPLGGSGASNSPSRPSASTLEALQAKKVQGTTPSEQIVPLLVNLPLPDTPSSQQSSINPSDKVWSLASVSLLLSPQSGHTPAETKQNRRLLLSQNFIARLVHALQSDTNVEVRREASGALRNLCVDAGFDVRAEVANKGGVDAVLGSMRWAANTLGFHVDGTSSAPKKPTTATSFVSDAPSPQEELERKRVLLSKPLDQMNKKEKRHATKLAAVMGKSLEQVAGTDLTTEDEKVLGGLEADNANGSISDSHSARSEPFVSLDPETRKSLLEMSENLATITWCLCESGGKAFGKLVTWKWTDEELIGEQGLGELPGQGLAAWLCGSIALGCRAALVLSTAAPDGSRQASTSTDVISSLKNEELSVLLDLALASANALCGLTDGGDAEFVNGLLGRRIPKAGGKKGAKVEEQLAASSIKEQDAGATQRLAEIDGAIALLEVCVDTDQQGLDKVKQYILSQTTMLGVLVSGTLRNVAASFENHNGKKRSKAPIFTLANIFVPARSGAVTLQQYEEQTILPALTRLLGSVDMTVLAKDLEGKADEPAEEERAKHQVRAEEKAQTLMLAIEVLAEMASEFDSVSDEQIEWMEDPDASDEMETEQDDFEALIDDDKEQDGMELDTFADAVKRGGSIRFDAITPVLSGIVAGGNTLAQVLIPLARPFESSFPSLSGTTNEAEAPSLLRGIHSRSLSVLNNVLLRLASFSAPPPSQPLTSPKDQRRVAAFRSWLQDGAQTYLSSTFQSLYEIARGCAQVPAVASASSSTEVESQVSAAAAKGKSSEAHDGLTMVEACIGSMWSIARCLEGAIPLNSGEVVTALFGAYNSALSDGMRVKSLCLLATIARAQDVTIETNESIALFLVDVLENVGAQTTAEAMVAAVNGVIDIYADETAKYDQVFRRNGLLKRVKATAFKCRACTRTIDKRRLPSLRASAEEAVENIQGFVEYRASLGL